MKRAAEDNIEGSDNVKHQKTMPPKPQPMNNITEAIQRLPGQFLARSDLNPGGSDLPQERILRHVKRLQSKDRVHDTKHEMWKNVDTHNHPERLDMWGGFMPSFSDNVTNRLKPKGYVDKIKYAVGMRPAEWDHKRDNFFNQSYNRRGVGWGAGRRPSISDEHRKEINEYIKPDIQKEEFKTKMFDRFGSGQGFNDRPGRSIHKNYPDDINTFDGWEGWQVPMVLPTLRYNVHSEFVLPQNDIGHVKPSYILDDEVYSGDPGERRDFVWHPMDNPSPYPGDGPQ